MPLSQSPEIFDRRRVRLLRDKASLRFEGHNFLSQQIEESLLDRLRDVTRDFKTVLCIGARQTHDFLDKLKQIKQFEHITVMDMSTQHLKNKTIHPNISFVCGDEERLPFSEKSFDLIIVHSTLHSVNDVPGALIQIRRSLKPDGLFLAAIPGGQTLHELKHCFLQAETELYGGASPRVSPFIHLSQMAELIQRGGFSLPVVDKETFHVEYSDLFSLLHDIRFMGEGLALTDHKPIFRPKAFFKRVEEIYQSEFAASESRLNACFEIIYALGWSPHESQQQPLRPGSGKTSLTEIL